MNEFLKATQNIREYELPQKKVIRYFFNHIKCGKSLSQEICRIIDFKQGCFFTILPMNIDQDKLLDFEHGGIIPKTGNVQVVISMDRNCSEFIKKFLNQSSDRVAVIENNMLTIDSPFVDIPNVAAVPWKNEVYYFLKEQNSINEIYTTLRKSGQIWHFLAVLTKLAIPDSLAASSIENICKNTELLIAGAYDGEGYIFWEKRNHRP